MVEILYLDRVALACFLLRSRAREVERGRGVLKEGGGHGTEMDRIAVLDSGCRAGADEDRDAGREVHPELRFERTGTEFRRYTCVKLEREVCCLRDLIAAARLTCRQDTTIKQSSQSCTMILPSTSPTSTTERRSPRSWSAEKRDVCPEPDGTRRSIMQDSSERKWRSEACGDSDSDSASFRCPCEARSDSVKCPSDRFASNE